MAHTVKKLDKKSPSNTVFSRLNPEKIEYMNPAPASPRMVTCDQKSRARQQKQICSSFINYKIEIPNDSAKKRKADDSSHSNSYGSNVKKPRLPVSPDLGCFMDYSSPFGQRDSMSPFTDSYPARSENTQTCRVETKAVCTQLDLEHVESGSTFPKDKVETEHSTKSGKVVLRLSPAFDHDVEDILSIGPLSHKAEDGNKEAKPALVAVEDDKGYVSTHDQKEEHHGESSLEQPLQEEAPIRGHQVSFLHDDLNTSGPLQKPANSSVRCLEGGDEEEEVWNIGAPLFESSICQYSSASEHGRRVSGYMAGDSTLETTYEESLPLQVQVKSKVEIPSHSAINKRAQEQKAGAENARSRRANIWNNKLEWDRKKRQYVASVTSHMTENQNATQGFVSELQNLMTHVSEQTGSHGAHWQHPSDLTCRNYQKQFGSETPTMTLDEWQAQNLGAHKRFCKVPKIFERSPFP